MGEVRGCFGTNANPQELTHVRRKAGPVLVWSLNLGGQHGHHACRFRREASFGAADIGDPCWASVALIWLTSYLATWNCYQPNRHAFWALGPRCTSRHPPAQHATPANRNCHQLNRRACWAPGYHDCSSLARTSRDRPHFERTAIHRKQQHR